MKSKLKSVTKYHLLLFVAFALFVFQIESMSKNVRIEKDISEIEDNYFQGVNSFMQNQVVTPGHGYSTDKQQISPIACYNARVLPITHTSSIVHFDQGMGFQDLQKALHVDVSAKASIGMFSSSLHVDYMKSVQDTDYSLSVNYYQYIEAQIVMETGYGQAAVLTADGMRAYQGGTNSDFGLICGDKFIDSYKAGATLVLGMKIQFHNSAQKDSFTFHAGASFGSFASVSTDIQNTASKYKIQGTVTIQGYQVGGNPSQLAKILDQKCGAHYCAAACDIQHMQNCVFVVDRLIQYAVNDFTSQVSVTDNKGLSSFPIGFASMVDIKWLGLVIPPSWVNYAVEQARTKLGEAFYENKYYIEKFHVLLDKYPVAWNKSSTLYKKAKSLYDAVNNNMNLLMDQQTGAITCYTDVKNCVNNTNKIFEKMVHLDSTALMFLNDTRQIYGFDCGNFYRTGDLNSSWTAKGNCVLAVYSVSIDNINYCFDFSLIDYRNSTCHLKTVGCLTSIDGGRTYSGQRDNWWVATDGNQGHGVDPVRFSSAFSPYYFQPYLPNFVPQKNQVHLNKNLFFETQNFINQRPT